MTEFESYKCPVCGAGTVSMQSAKGQTRHFRRGVARPVPATVLIPTCSACGEVFMGVEDSKRVDEALRAALQEEQPSRVRALVEALRHLRGASLREIEQACAVTPSYLSHVLNGRRIASETLLRLIEAFAVCPSEFERYRTGVATRIEAYETEKRIDPSDWRAVTAAARAVRVVGPWTELPSGRTNGWVRANEWPPNGHPFATLIEQVEGGWLGSVSKRVTKEPIVYATIEEARVAEDALLQKLGYTLNDDVLPT